VGHGGTKYRNARQLARVERLSHDRAGRDPVTGKRRHASRVFRGNLRGAKKTRAVLLVEVSKGRHTGSQAALDDPVRRVDHRAAPEGRPPNTVHGYELVYKRNIQPTLGTIQITKVTTKSTSGEQIVADGVWNKLSFGPALIVDDGSGPPHAEAFEAAV
jgi:hypothetical protein